MFRRNIWTKLRYICYIPLLPVYYISLIIPRNKKLWIFGSWFGRKFADNSKYLFLYAKRNHPEIRVIWLTHSQKVIKKLKASGYEVYKTYSIKGFWYSMRAGCVIFSSGVSDVNKFVIDKAKRVQLWHGVPLKKLCYDNKLHYGKLYKNLKKLKNTILPFMAKIKNYNLCIALSEEGKINISSAFRLDKHRISIAGHPRNDALFDPIWLIHNKCNFLCTIRNKVNFKYVFTYVPTWRKNNKVDLFSKYNFQISILSKILERLNAIFIAKAHHATHQFNLSNNIDISQRIYFLSDDEMPDIYPLLKETDILITDYSSVYVDYLLLNRPIIFAPFDINEYLSEDREFYYDYNEITPGPKAKDWPEVFKIMQDVIKEDSWKRQRESVCKRLNKFTDNKNSERVFNTIQKELSCS